jgi:4-aminobutyrate aminotransferase
MMSKKKVLLCERVVKEDNELLSLSTRLHYYPLVVSRAEGAKVFDVDGNEYIDFLSGAATTNIGHRHPEVVKAIKEQCDLFIHNTLAYGYYEVAVKLARKLVEITPGDFRKRVAFGLSGSDSNDGAIKLARSYTGRSKIIAFLNSYHGTTYGALTISGITLNMKRRLGPLLPEIYHVPFPDCYRCLFKLEYPSCGLQCLGFLKTLFETIVPPEEVAAVITEPIQGDAGVVIPPDDYMIKLTELCRNYGILFAVDEIQTGFGRTGKWFAVEHWSLKPDILVMAKAIASGMPLSAIVSKSEIMEKWKAPAHLFTTQANPLSCVAAITTINVIKKERLLERAKRLGEYTLKRFREMMDEHELIGDVRGKGLLIGVDLVKNRETKEPAVKEAHKVDWRAWEKGLVLIHYGKSVLRIAPPLTISQEEMDKGLSIIEEAIDDVEKGKVSNDVLKRMEGW